MIEEMIKAMNQNKEEIAECIEMFGFMTEKDNAKVSIHIAVMIPDNRTECVFNGIAEVKKDRRSCRIDQLNEEDIEALKEIICRNVTNLKNRNAELANMMISILQEDADQGSGEK